MGLLIDAGVLLEAERGRLDLDRQVARHGRGEAFLSVVTAGDLLYGAQRAAEPGAAARRAAFVESALERLAVLPVDLACARAHARLRTDLGHAEADLGCHDLWLVATCIAYGLRLATADARGLARVPGLRVEVWGD